VLNQLMRKARDRVMAVLATIDRQRDLQLGALSGRIDAARLAEARAAETEAVAKVLAAVPAILEGDGHAASKSNIDRVARCLRAAALDAEERELLLGGRLIRDVSESGFEAVAAQLDPALLLAALSQKNERGAPAPARKVDGLFARSTRSDADRAPPKTEPLPSRPDHPEDRAERLAQAKVASAELRAQIDEQRATLDACESRRATLEKDLDAAKAEARMARRRLGDLNERLEQAERRIRLLAE
jgi:hypothetical protein